MDILQKRLENKKILSGSSTSKLRFASWRRPIKGVEWQLWFEKLSDLHQSTWKKIGIYQAIKNTTYNIKRDDNLVLEMVSRWSSQTNTFVFGWGEASITLEDILILGGFPALGISPLSSIEDDLKAMSMKNQLEQARLQIQRTKLHNAYQCNWMEKFQDSEDSELEHAAFIAIWLSRYVFPSLACHSDIINKKALSLAVQLSKGVQIALGQTVLAMLYRDLTELSKMMRSIELDQPPKVYSYGGLFHIVQVWAWERFMLLRPIKNFISADPNLPGLARWSGVASLVNHRCLRAFMNYSEQGFVWCPYGAFSTNEITDLRSFAHWIKDSELIGFDSCIEKYYPQRVLKQFGLEQDLPSDKIHITEDVKVKIHPSFSPSSVEDMKPKLLNMVDDFPPGFPQKLFEIIDVVDSDSDDDDCIITKVRSSKIPGSVIGSKRPFPSSTESLTTSSLENKAESSAKGKNVIIQCKTFEELLFQVAPGTSSKKGKNVGIQLGSTENLLMQNTTPSHMIKAGSSDKTVGIQHQSTGNVFQHSNMPSHMMKAGSFKIGQTVGIQRGSVGNVLQQNATPYFLNQSGSSSQSGKDTMTHRGTFENVVLQGPPGFINNAGSWENIKTVGIQRGSTGHVLQQNAATCLVNKVESSHRGQTAVIQHGKAGGVLSPNDLALINKATLHRNERSQNPGIRPAKRITIMEHIAYAHIIELEAAGLLTIPDMQKQTLLNYLNGKD